MKPLTKIISLAALATVALTSCNNMVVSPVSPSGMKTITIRNIGSSKQLVESGTFKGMGSATVNTPLILPGQEVSFSFYAGKGQTLNFATMYGWSKDCFFAPADSGLALYHADGTPVTGDISDQIMLWDDGTKTNGKINPSGPAVGGGNLVSRPIKEIGGSMDNDGNSFLPASMLMNVTLTYNDTTSQFTITIKNISGGTQNTTPFSPGVWAVSNSLGGHLSDPMPYFTDDSLDRGNGLAKIAQMGDNSKLTAYDSANTGIIIPLSPVLVVVYHKGNNPVFKVNEKDFGQGLADIAQKGMASTLASALKNMPGVTNVYVLGSSPILPGGMETGQIQYANGDKIFIATMFGTSNDWFFANETGMNANKSGDVSNMISLYDDGTALEQYPGAGNRQAGFGGIQIPESNPIMEVGNTFPIPPAKDVIQVSLN